MSTLHPNAPSYSADELLAAINAEIQKQDAPVPDGFMTIEGWAAAWSVSWSTAARKIQVAIKIGLMKEVTVKRKSPSGSGHWVRYFGR